MCVGVCWCVLVCIGLCFRLAIGCNLSMSFISLLDYRLFVYWFVYLLKRRDRGVGHCCISLDERTEVGEKDTPVLLHWC